MGSMYVGKLRRRSWTAGYDKCALSSKVINARNWGSRVFEPDPCGLFGVLGGWDCYPAEMADLCLQEGGDRAAPRDGFGGSRQGRA